MLELTHTVLAREEGKTLGVLLRQALYLSGTAIKGLVRAGGLSLDGAPARLDARPMAGSVIHVQLPQPPVHSDAPAEEEPIPVLFEDQALLAVHKPAGLPTHPSLSIHSGTALGRVLGHLKRTGQPLQVHPVSRLDTHTSGILLFAKHPHIHARLCTLGSQGASDKTYEGVCLGHFPGASGTIDLPIGRVAGSFLLRQVDPDGQSALTLYQVMTQGQVEGQAASVVSFILKTGRTHQIRVHCQALGCALLGDSLYPTPASQALLARLPFQGQLLHACRLSFPHPLDGTQVVIHCPPSRWPSGCLPSL